MTITQFNYLDIPNLIFNELIGNVWVGYFFGAVVISWIGIKSNAGGHALLGFNIMWAFSVVSYQQNDMILAVIGLIVAFLYYGVMSKYITR